MFYSQLARTGAVSVCKARTMRRQNASEFCNEFDSTAFHDVTTLLRQVIVLFECLCRCSVARSDGCDVMIADARAAEWKSS